jgi:LPXTG-motif cell wall-anchored protein
MYGGQLPTTGFSGVIYVAIGLCLIVAAAVSAGARWLLGLFR